MVAWVFLFLVVGVFSLIVGAGVAVATGAIGNGATVFGVICIVVMIGLGVAMGPKVTKR